MKFIESIRRNKFFVCIVVIQIVFGCFVIGDAVYDSYTTNNKEISIHDYKRLSEESRLTAEELKAVLQDDGIITVKEKAALDQIVKDKKQIEDDYFKEQERNRLKTALEIRN
jgi:hypothetical protein